MHKRSILIIGGGTAGWMTANLFAKQWADKGFSITLLDSEDIAPIGVGEGSTPYIKRLFDQLEIPEQEWMPQCQATYKNGIKFNNWTDKPDYQSYFHPFAMDLDSVHLATFKQHTMLKRQGVDINVHPDDYFVMSNLTKLNRLPLAGENFPFQAHYAYHFDAGLLGEFLKQHAIGLGVKHLSEKVTKVEVHLNYDLAAVHTKSGKRIEADFFIDCTGFRALLIGKTLGVPFVSFKDNLLNDAAVALPSQRQSVPTPQTLSEGLNCGWRWQIPLTHRTGNGYVYSSDHLNGNEAEEELRKVLGHKVLDAEARHLKMRVGRSQKHWEKNCLAVGLSQGFIEPLEATALQIVQITIEQFIEQYEKGNYTNRYQDYFNDGVTASFEHIRDYVLVHYLANTRKDTQYWKDCRGDVKISDSLRQVLEVWSAGQDIDQELARQDIAKYYPSLSWHVILSGMGVFPKAQPQTASSRVHVEQEMKHISRFIKRSLLNYPER